MNLTNLFWLFIFLTALWPAAEQRAIMARRVRLIQSLQRERGSHVIVLIHRQETVGLFGIPIMRYIDIDDSEAILRAIRGTPPNMPIDIILHTPGGLVLATEQIAHAIKRHPAPVTVFVPHYAMSGGTLVALAADKIVMDTNAVLGPVDPQIGEYPAASILRVLERKPVERVDDQTLILADMAEKAVAQVRALVYDLLADHMEPEKAKALSEALTSGRWTHDYPISIDEVRAMGLPVSDDMPPEIYALMRLYPQTGIRRPSVQYIPLPRGQDEQPNGGDRRNGRNA